LAQGFSASACSSWLSSASTSAGASRKA
jgi:hypothetical protein